MIARPRAPRASKGDAGERDARLPLVRRLLEVEAPTGAALAFVLARDGQKRRVVQHFGEIGVPKVARVGPRFLQNRADFPNGHDVVMARAPRTHAPIGFTQNRPEGRALGSFQAKMLSEL
jgi:hypothetical protein